MLASHPTWQQQRRCTLSCRHACNSCGQRWQRGCKCWNEAAPTSLSCELVAKILQPASVSLRSPKKCAWVFTLCRRVSHFAAARQSSTME